MVGLRYSNSVDYDTLDSWKEEAMRRSEETFGFPEWLGIRLIRDSVGSTAAVFELDDMPAAYLAFVVEGLGTKIKAAENMAEKERIGKGIGLNRRKLFAGIGRDEMACVLNDLGAVGAHPAGFEPINASGDSAYFTDQERNDGLLDGYVEGARIARVAIPGGETPTLKMVVFPDTLDIAGGAFGLVKPKSNLVLGQGMEPNLTIYGVSSSGIQANGVSLAREIAEKLKDGYFSRLPSGRTLGEALLSPAVIYTPLVKAMFDEGVDIRGMQHITGHGWAKVMRYKKPFTYLIENVPKPQEEFGFMQQEGPVDIEEAYRTWNMGVGWVVFAPANDSARMKRACDSVGRSCYELGYVKAGEREVAIPNLGIGFRPKVK